MTEDAAVGRGWLQWSREADHYVGQVQTEFRAYGLRGQATVDADHAYWWLEVLDDGERCGVGKLTRDTLGELGGVMAIGAFEHALAAEIADTATGLRLNIIVSAGRPFGAYRIPLIDGE